MSWRLFLASATLGFNNTKHPNAWLLWRNVSLAHSGTDSCQLQEAHYNQRATAADCVWSIVASYDHTDHHHSQCMRVDNQ